MHKVIDILMKAGPHRGTIELSHGTISRMSVVSGEGMAGDRYELGSGESRLRLECDGVALDPGADATVVYIRDERTPFCFFLRDVQVAYPLYVPEYGVSVTLAEDRRDFTAIRADIAARGGLSKLERYAVEPQESFAAAAAATRDMKCPIWLGLSRDIRLFEVGFRGEDMSSSFSASQQDQVVWDWIKPRNHSVDVRLPQLGGEAVQYSYMLGRGLGCAQRLTRHLDGQVLPILHAELDDEDVVYQATFLTAYGARPLEAGGLRGTHYLVADAHSHCHVLTEEQEELARQLRAGELSDDEMPVLFCEVRAENRTGAPRYCWLRLPLPNLGQMPERAAHAADYDGSRGFGLLGDGTVYMTATLNGKPCPQVETAVLLLPGASARYVFAIPHMPVSRERAQRIAAQDFTSLLESCRAFWKGKLADAARVELPERRVQEMMQAGILHLELVAYGREPDEPVAPVVGVYSPIGSESSPIIQFLDSAGKSDLARRELAYFFAKQRADGFMQNFTGYMLETGAVLWTLGEHYRYTRDLAFIRSLQENICRACSFIADWRRSNMVDSLRGRGYGMISGKVADPQDDYHSFMLNGYAYVGLARSAEMLMALGDEAAEKIGEEAKALLADIRVSLASTMASSPLVPLGNGTWCPSVAPWTEYDGPLALYAKGGSCMTHGGITLRDSLLGPGWLFILEVVDPREPMGQYILNLTTEHFNMRNVGLSQPYYGSHPYAHLRRGEVNAYLKELYNGVASLADRETYTFWEHYFHDSPHKTHEEAWFLMRCRWMLYVEEGRTLRLLPCAPDAWYRRGRIAFSGMRSYFGEIGFSLETEGDGVYRIDLRFAEDGRLPQRVEIRLPVGPDGAACSRGKYDAVGQCVVLEEIKGKEQHVLVTVGAGGGIRP